MTKNIDLTPQETEQLSRYASDDAYVQQQKEDIMELTSMFRDMMGVPKTQDGSASNEFVDAFNKAFHPEPDVEASYIFKVDGFSLPLVITVEGSDLKCLYRESEKADVEISVSHAKLSEIVSGSTTFQRAFMAGDMKMKGDFKALRLLDSIFVFD